MRSSTLAVFGRTIADLALIGLFSIPVLFAGLGALPIVIWDESRLANNAIEMSRSGFSLVTTYLGHPDLWNTKPPLLIWLQILSFKLFGLSEWALRFPSALAGLATSWLVYWFCRKVTSSRATGIAGAVALLTTSAFVAPHVTITGDYDALLVFFTTAIFVYSYFLLDDVWVGARASNRVLAAISLALTGAIMTKGVAGLLILPGIALMSLTGRVLPKILRDWRVWLAACLPITVAAGFYVARESASGGYLEAVWTNELGGRFAESLEGHLEPAMFYVRGLLLPPISEMDRLNLGTAIPWSWLALALLPFGVGNAQFVRPQMYLTVVLAAFVFVISAAQTRIFWYVAPAYPLIACLATVSAFAVFQRALVTRQILQIPSGIFVLSLFAIIGTIISWQIVERNRGVVKGAYLDHRFQSAAFLQKIQPVLKPGSTLRIVRERGRPSIATPDHMEYSPQEAFYAAVLQTHGIDASVVTPGYLPRRADLLMWCDPVRVNAGHLAIEPLASQGPCRLVRIGDSQSQRSAP